MNQELKVPVFQTGDDKASYTNKVDVKKLKNMGKEIDKMGKNSPILCIRKFYKNRLKHS